MWSASGPQGRQGGENAIGLLNHGGTVRQRSSGIPVVGSRFGLRAHGAQRRRPDIEGRAAQPVRSLCKLSCRCTSCHSRQLRRSLGGKRIDHLCDDRAGILAQFGAQ
jgi:hypothetical protein